MRDSVLCFMLLHRSKYFKRPYSPFVFLILPFALWFAVEILHPAEQFFTSSVFYVLLFGLNLFSLIILLLALYVKMDCSRDIFIVRIDDVIAARAFYALCSLTLGLAAAFAGYSINLAYLALIMFFALRDSHLKQAKWYWFASLVLAFIETLLNESLLDSETLFLSVNNWLIQWLMAAAVYCVCDCLSITGSNPSFKAMDWQVND